MDNQERRRGHFHRGRRSPDRRGQERRTPPAQEQQHQGRDHVDVEQIMRDIRARIAQRHGIELSTQQIQDLAARRLEAILDPRALKPALLDQLRKSAGGHGDQAPSPPGEPPYTFAEGAIYESHRGIVRFFRRLFKPLLMLLFNPAPLERALAAQSRINVEAAQRDAGHQKQQAEWNALHYEILQRLVTEVSRVSIDVQSLSTRIESLAAKVDFNERRVRHIEGNLHQARPQGRPVESAPQPAASAAFVPSVAAAPAPEGAPAAEPASETPQTGEAARRRRRRRRGRRGGGLPGEGAPQAAGAVTAAAGGEASLPDDEPDETGEPDEAGDVAGDGADDRRQELALPPQEFAPPPQALAPPPQTFEPPPQVPVPEPEPVPFAYAHGQAAEPTPEPEPAPAPIAAHAPVSLSEAPPPGPSPFEPPAAEPEPQPSVHPPAAAEPDRTE